MVIGLFRVVLHSEGEKAIYWQVARWWGGGIRQRCHRPEQASTSWSWSCAKMQEDILLYSWIGFGLLGGL